MYGRQMWKAGMITTSLPILMAHYIMVSVKRESLSKKKKKTQLDFGDILGAR